MKTQPLTSIFIATAGVSSLLIALLHVVIIFVGAEGYRYFGAGEEMAQMAERGELYPTIATSIITLIFAIWGLYGLSSAGVIRKLPLLKPALWTIAVIFCLRGLMLIPFLFLLNSPYANELRERPVFTVLTSLVSLLLGIGYLSGARKLM
ncbi:MAG: hypothetical protein MI748_17405 [Opitutales bacterium]|nr:hypothetical protein [Opitutales bacterium]